MSQANRCAVLGVGQTKHASRRVDVSMAGLVPDADIQIEVVGLRPGEKLNEELMMEDEEATCRVDEKIQVILEVSTDTRQIVKHLDAHRPQMVGRSYAGLQKQLRRSDGAR